MRQASGLSEELFAEFVTLFDLSGTGQQSRFASKANIVGLMTTVLGDDVSSEFAELQKSIQEAMLPESHRDVITEKELLTWFKLGSRDGLFPAPADISLAAKRIPRAAAGDAIALIAAGHRPILLRGDGGCGKTTLMQEISERLPPQSISVLFDCFGAGRSFHSDDKRHLGPNAFLQLTNDLAVAMELPLLIPRNYKNPSTIRSYMDKLRLAADALKLRAPEAILLVKVDAADNSVAAADDANPKERPFVFDLVRANLASLPDNVRIIVSARTSRADKLDLPTGTKSVDCPAFERNETEQHLEAAFGSVSPAYVDQFHALSNHNPRVQAYAIGGASGNPEKALDLLMPGGKTVRDVLEKTFEIALKKLGQEALFEQLVATLAHLPAPASVTAVARLANTSKAIVRDFVADLAPGLRLQDHGITIADEDFDDFIKSRAEGRRASTLQAIAADFLATYREDAYSSLHLADSLVNAGRANELLAVIQNDAQPAAITDPIVRRQVQVRRLKLSLAACRSAGNPVDALKIVLISAEAERDDTTLADILSKELDLSVDFGGPSLRRTILLDRDRVTQHGPFLAHESRCAANNGNHVGANESLRSFRAWMKRRRTLPDDELEAWKISDRDVAARTEAILELAGPEVAVQDIMQWTPRGLPLRVAHLLTPQLIASKRAAKAQALLDTVARRGPWNLCLAIPIAMSGVTVDADLIGRSLRRLRSRFIPSPDHLTGHNSDEHSPRHVLDTYITACELGYVHKADSAALARALSTVIGVHGTPNTRTFHRSDVSRFDALVRCWLLRAAMEGKTATEQEFLDYMESLAPPPKPTTKKPTKQQQRECEDSEKDERDRRRRVIQALFPIYQSRMGILDAAREGRDITDAQVTALGKTGSDTYYFDRTHESIIFRENAARSTMRLLIVPSLNAETLGKQAINLLSPRFADPFATRKIPIWRGMMLRPEGAARVIIDAASAARDIKATPASASERVEALVRLARLLRPLSRADSEVLFNDAVSIAKEIDREAIDQIAFLAEAARRAEFPSAADRRRVASQIYSYVTVAASRLADNDGFPWRAGIRAMTKLDPALALAVISGWADKGIRSIDRTLETFIATGLDSGTITTDLAIPLFQLVLYPDSDFVEKHLAQRAASDAAKGKLLLDELARNVLLFNPRSDRRDLAQNLVGGPCIDTKPDGPWLAALKNMLAFLETERTPTRNQHEIPGPNLRPASEDDDTPKSYEFDPTGKTFLISASIENELKTAKASELRYSERGLLRKMRDASSSPGDRVAFLTAVAEIPEDTCWFYDRFLIIDEAIKEWRGTPSVDNWLTTKLPDIIISQFLGATRLLREGSAPLPRLMDLATLDAAGRQRVIFDGLAKAGTELGSSTLFGLAELIVASLAPEEAATVLAWYAQRVNERVSPKERPSLPLAEVPEELTESIGRFLFALMTDVDTRIRWAAAHALRRLVILGRDAEARAVFEQISRIADPVYRIPDAPFYYLAGRLWLLVAAYRISAETPAILRTLQTQLMEIAISRDLPHIAIREYAKRTLMQLASNGTITVSTEDGTKLGDVNQPEIPQRMNDKTYGRTFDAAKRNGIRFEFDGLDTLRYWYVDILRLFPSADPGEVLKIADQWIMDRWGGDAEARHWDKEPRKERYSERRFSLWSNSHGGMPTLERAGTYLEWHAMHCVIGELLRTHPLTDETDYTSYESWVAESMPSEPPPWIADHRGPTPLVSRFWTEDERTDKGWLQNFRLDEFQSRHLGPVEGWIAVAGHDTSRFPKRREEVNIDTALVSPPTASALLRALQTASNSHDFRIPPEADDLQIDEAPYHLQGWIASGSSEGKFDLRDPFRYEVGVIRERPGAEVSKTLGLGLVYGTQPTWHDKSGHPAFKYTAWCDEPSPEDEQFDRHTRSDGWSLAASTGALSAFPCQKTNGPPLQSLCRPSTPR